MSIGDPIFFWLDNSRGLGLAFCGICQLAIVPCRTGSWVGLVALAAVAKSNGLALPVHLLLYLAHVPDSMEGRIARLLPGLKRPRNMW
jgi:phosphatidylserine synthase